MIVRRIDKPGLDLGGDTVPVEKTAAGVHAIIELYDCPSDLLNDEAYVRDAICQAAEVAGAHLLNISSHGFSPQGVTAIALLAESHISIHTWPETGYAAADMFTCGRQDMAVAAAKHMVKQLRSGRHSTTYLARGEMLHSNQGANAKG